MISPQQTAMDPAARTAAENPPLTVAESGERRADDSAATRPEPDQVAHVFWRVPFGGSKSVVLGGLVDDDFVLAAATA